MRPGLWHAEDRKMPGIAHGIYRPVAAEWREIYPLQVQLSRKDSHSSGFWLPSLWPVSQRDPEMGVHLPWKWHISGSYPRGYVHPARLFQIHHVSRWWSLTTHSYKGTRSSWFVPPTC